MFSIGCNPNRHQYGGGVWEVRFSSMSLNTSWSIITLLINISLQPEWMKTREYWDKTFEQKYEIMKKDPEREPLKIIVVPHSHNDPGWLKTFVNYFQSDTRQILNLAVTRLPEFSNMTFIWSEISFLQLWWDQAHPTKQRVCFTLHNN